MGFYNNAGGIAHPTTKEELIKEINIRLDRGQTNLNDIDTSKITDMSSLFYHVFQRRAIKNIDVSLWNTSNVTTMSYMFFGCSNLQKMAVAYSGTITASNWEYFLTYVSSTGTFYYSKNQTKENIQSIVPSGWTLVQSTEW